MEMHRVGGSEKYRCPICKIKFMDNDILEKHTRVHMSANIKSEHISDGLPKVVPDVIRLDPLQKSEHQVVYEEVEEKAAKIEK